MALAPALPPAKESPWEIEFGFLIDFRKALMRPDEAARILGRSTNYIYAAIEAGDLEAFKPKGREVNRYMISRRSVALHLAETCTLRTGDWMNRVQALLGEMSESQLGTLTNYIAVLKRRKFA